MPLDGREVRRVDVGAGVYVSLPADTADLPLPESRSRRVPALALALGAALSGAALARLGITADGLLSAGLLPVLVALAAVDLRARVLPSRIIGPAMLAVLAWQLAFFADRVPECLLA